MNKESLDPEFLELEKHLENNRSWRLTILILGTGLPTTTIAGFTNWAEIFVNYPLIPCSGVIGLSGYFLLRQRGKYFIDSYNRNKTVPQSFPELLVHSLQKRPSCDINRVEPNLYENKWYWLYSC
ncbi:MAG: hypothetical protein V1808_00745 [Candidatus Daviesbacteria bacterium]